MSLRSTILLVLACALCECSCGTRPPEGKARRVILLSCDTLRADHLGVYGYRYPTSPHVDALARECTTFDEAYTTAPWTRPAISALLTGRPPDEIGMAYGNKTLLSPEAVTIQEIARDAGYGTAAIVSNWILRKLSGPMSEAGVAQGFQHFDDTMTVHEGNRDAFERRAPETADAAIAWLDEAKRTGDDRFFLWVHFQDPHGPYTPPPQMLARVERSLTNEPPVPIGTTQRCYGEIPVYQVVDGETRPEAYRMRYDGEIAFFDEHLGRIIDELKRCGWWEDSLVVFTSDHGESLGEHGCWFGHGENTHREEVRVPLLVHFPEGSQHVGTKGGRVGELAGHLDLWPTFLEALGLPPRPNRGLSLFARELPKGRVNGQMIGVPGTERRWTAWSNGRLRFVRRGDEPGMLFDVLSDPGELRDLAATEPARIPEFSRAFDAWMADHALPKLPVLLRGADEAAQQALKSLGYTEGGEH